MDIRLHILEEITNGFSVDSRIGRGGYGDVYKGVYNGEVIAMKLLHVDTVQGLDDQQFKNEVGNLLRVKHPNIVRLLGYCYEIRFKFVKYNGEDVFGKHIYRVLCFEYFQGGSLDMHLHAPSLAPNWSTRYNIIKGVCEGLNFLHGCEPPILHLDLKPANILLDSSMVSKVADFGLSRLFTQSRTHVTEKIVGTQKYMPPEFVKEGMISPKNDVFSLGVVIIEIMTGPAGYSDFLEMDSVIQFMQEVHTSWSTMIKATSEYPSEELHQVNTCIDTAIRCVDSERNNRPTIAGILDALNMTETHIPTSSKKTHIPQGQSADVPCLRIGPKTMTDEVDYIANKKQHFNCMPTSFNTNVQQVTDRETSSIVEPTLIIGRNEEKHRILSTLSESNTEEMAILPIYGIGGIGKTTLAQLVFNDTQFQNYSRVWIYVSQKFDLNKIGNSIITQLTNEISHISDTQMLHNRLGELFAGKRILIVLDDLWEQDPYQLDKLNTMLRPRLGSKVVIVTTRDEAIARKISRSVVPYQINFLTNDMCWSIIKQKSSFEDRDDKRYLEHIGRDIAIKCGGVALAAQSLGYMLREMESDQWESVRDSYIWNLSTMEDPSLRSHEVLLSLLLSYSHMHEFLQLCFSYCAVFPKGHNIVKYDLIHQWIALGLTGPSSTFDSMQLCEKYITQLLGMSFLQRSKTPSSVEYQDKDVTLFTMHDLVHDLARATLADKVNKEGNAVGSSCHYALLTDCSKPLQLSVSSTKTSRFKKILNPFQKKSSPENIKALHFLGCAKEVLCGGSFSPATCLRVLDLSECFIRKLPDSVGQLKQLRYLRAPRINDRMIPDSITKLSELSYLNLSGSSKISALPESIGDLKGLMHLDLSGCHAIYTLPVSFAELKQLVHLDLSHCIMSISESFGSFTKLQYLNLSVRSHDDIMHHSLLELKDHQHKILKDYRHKLLGLNILGNRRVLSKFIGNLIKLRYLNLSGSLDAMTPLEGQITSFLGSISTLPNLEHLDLSDNRELSSIPESMGNLRKLHRLDLSHCEQLKGLPDSMVNMVSLKVLNVDRRVTVNESVLSLLNVAPLPHFVVHASSHKYSSNIISLQPTNPVELTIDRLENVKSAEEAQSIKLIEKQQLKDLAFKWTVGAGRFVDDKEVLEKLVPPRSVHKLYIKSYMSANFPDWLMGIRHYLPNLTEIDLCDFTKCDNLPPLGQLPSLKLLNLSSMGGLEEWNTTYTSGEEGANESLFPKLERLSINYCDKLRIKPCLPRAMSLFIVDCDKVISSWRESLSQKGASSSPMTDLLVRESSVPLHQWRLLHQLPHLSSLVIESCSDLTASPEIIQHLSCIKSLTLKHNDQAELPSWLVELTSLQKLILYDRSMTSLPQWLGELTTLKSFEIYNSDRIRSLPDSIMKLTNLEYLRIDNCAALFKWIDSDGNRVKLSHIREKHIADLSCFDRIRYCAALAELAQSSLEPEQDSEWSQLSSF